MVAMQHEAHRDRIDLPTLVVINLLLTLIAAVLIFGPQVIFYVALVLAPLGLTMVVALSRGYGQPAL
jgi:hypothetical protein